MVAAAVLVRPSQTLTATILVVAMAWGALPVAIDAIVTRRDTVAPPKQEHGTYTVIICIGDEPVEETRASVIAAASTGPTAVAAIDRSAVDALGPLPVPVFVESTFEAALRRAAHGIDTDAVLIVSPSSFPVADACEAAAGSIRGGAGWVIGSSPVFNNDGYAVETRDVLGRQQRRSARACGLDLWERDATVVKTQLLRDIPIEPMTPWGGWLRALRKSGEVGVEQRMAVAVSAYPVNARRYWIDAVAERRRQVADLADAVRTGRGSPRWVALGLLLRNLHAYPLTIWLMAPLLIAQAAAFPFRCSPVALLCVVGMSSAFRWLVDRRVTHMELRPLHDALAAAYDAPCSILALSAALTRRVEPTRVGVLVRPLAWTALALTAITAVPLLAPGRAERDFVVLTALVELVLLWLFAMRAFFQRNWARSIYRIPVALSATFEGRSATTMAVSPIGMALVGRFDVVPRGSRGVVEVCLDEGPPLRIASQVMDRRLSGEADVIGLSLQLDGDDRRRWTAQVARAARANVAAGQFDTARRPVRTASSLPPTVLLFDRLAAVLIVGLSLVGVAALVLLLLGYRPLVVRSGSMVPTLRVGDLIVVEEIEATDVRVGDIVTFVDPTGGDETITHRVRAVTDDGALRQFETKGDDNILTESWSIPTTTTVTKEVWRVPAVGLLVTWVAGDRTYRVFLAAVLTMVSMSVLWTLRSATLRRRED
ncbi:MAG: signal peptidase I [Acidimicrobiales bacterium]